jgi:hypothetical protein
MAPMPSPTGAEVRHAAETFKPQFYKARSNRANCFFPSSFERMVATLKISPKEYRSSPKLKEWVRRNKDHKYVPTELLQVFGFQVDT